MSALRLDGKIVKDVSRSFYLTLRLLPGSIREVISLGYLLARVSDTIADTADLPTSIRSETLNHYRLDVTRGAASTELLTLLNTHFSAQRHAGEQVLMRHVKEILSALSRFSETEQALLRNVTQTITDGQCWDLSFFNGEEKRIIPDAQLLENYTYQVAGCVGEFWTEILTHHGYLRPEELPEMRTLGRHYGKGLQLTNIIRDIPEDYENGRLYLPAPETSLKAQITASTSWIKKAESYLKDGVHYSRTLPAGRLRLGTELPAHLALETLKRLRETPPEQRKEHVKISRNTVYKEGLKLLLWR